MTVKTYCVVLQKLKSKLKNTSSFQLLDQSSGICSGPSRRRFRDDGKSCDCRIHRKRLRQPHTNHSTRQQTQS